MRNQSTEAFTWYDAVYIAVAGAFLYACLNITGLSDKNSYLNPNHESQLVKLEPVRRLDNLQHEIEISRSERK